MRPRRTTAYPSTISPGSGSCQLILRWVQMPVGLHQYKFGSTVRILHTNIKSVIYSMYCTTFGKVSSNSSIHEILREEGKQRDIAYQTCATAGSSCLIPLDIMPSRADSYS